MDEAGEAVRAVSVSDAPAILVHHLSTGRYVLRGAARGSEPADLDVPFPVRLTAADLLGGRR